jgi:hypothetical protein
LPGAATGSVGVGLVAVVVLKSETVQRTLGRAAFLRGGLCTGWGYLDSRPVARLPMPTMLGLPSRCST